MLPDYKLLGEPKRYKNGRGVQSASFLQKYRLLDEKKIRIISLKTTDRATAQRRAIRFVEDRIAEDFLASDPTARTAGKGITVVLKEYIDDLVAIGDSERHIALARTRINRIIKQAKYKEYRELDAVTATKAIAKLMVKHKFCVNTGNHYRATLRAWSHWMMRNGRWPINTLQTMGKIKGDTSSSRKRAILTDDEFEKLLLTVKDGPDRRNLSGEQRYWLYLIASQTGLRAQELDSLKPSSFHLDVERPYVEIHCTISKRRKTDQIILRRDFAEMLCDWFANLDPDRRLWGCSESWFNKAAGMLRLDLEAADIEHKRGDAVVDFHSFRCYRVTKALLSGANSRVVMSAVRLSSESLLARYAKILPEDIAACVDAVPLPNAATMPIIVESVRCPGTRRRRRH